MKNRTHMIICLLFILWLLVGCSGTTESNASQSTSNNNEQTINYNADSEYTVVDVREYTTSESAIYYIITVILENDKNERFYVSCDTGIINNNDDFYSLRLLVPGDRVRHLGGYKFERIIKDTETEEN